jgi:thioesterase domain-containing protein/acyl carrier protein
MAKHRAQGFALAERLPSYMVPSHIVALDSFPIARSGKIDRSALPPPYRKTARSWVSGTPSDDCQHQLLAIWKEVLKTPNIGIDDDFFELGGTSLQVLMMFARVEARLGFDLSPTTIFQAPTIAHLAEFIRAATSIAASQSLVPLRASGTGLPLFLMHTRSRLDMYFRDLLKDLKSDRPVFGLQPPALDGKHRIPRTITSMAADYVTEIQRVRPRGPYFLAGYSFGGLVTFEIAQQLIREGEQVSFLGLIDTTFQEAPIEGLSRVSSSIRLARKVRAVRGFQGLLFSGLRFVRLRLLDLWCRLGRSIPYEDRSIYYYWVCKRANRGYVPEPYPGHITMFSSAGNSARQRAHWGPLARGGLTVLEVPAGHSNMVSPPHSQILAKYFDTCLDATVREI